MDGIAIHPHARFRYEWNVRHVSYAIDRINANAVLLFSDFVRLEGGGKKGEVVQRFNNDDDVAVFLLHTLSQGAGLNLVAARYVFLVEPLLHSSIESQAVGRVHRIGQTKETTVFQYYIANTVDQRVAELRGRQGTSLFLTGEPREDASARVTDTDDGPSRANINLEVIDDQVRHSLIPIRLIVPEAVTHFVRVYRTMSLLVFSILSTCATSKLPSFLINIKYYPTLKLKPQVETLN